MSPGKATNTVTYTLLDTPATSADELTITFRSISNEDGRTNLSFDLVSSNTPFTIYKARWSNGGALVAPSEPFSLTAQFNEVQDRNTRWHISLDFPFRDVFYEKDELILTTDRGVIHCPTSRSGQLMQSIDLLRYDYERQLATTKRSSRNAWTFLGIALGGMTLLAVFAFAAVRRLVGKRREIEELSLLVAERSDRNQELKEKIDSLYGSRLDTFNMLCNEYFEKNESQRVRLTLYNEVERHILALRDSGSVAELEAVVDTYLDNMMKKVREQIPSLSPSDLRFLTYLYAGFSPRAVCIFTDIKIKNFYNRRSRLKARILGSDAPDRELFASKM
ncbi:MAG: hypothetical protein J6K95_06085 [Rikenellaceae bacterium]|nr:hypothetical protein [Rikenellaceae bacterium]